ncbi:MAG TPA: ribonuclease HII [Ignavibacteriaceae bacterium]|nr:ribonuclease HII [Ignavibacteriaceae bacterium]
MNAFDKSFLTENIKLIAGTDEVGRGPLAGPVVAASVIFPLNTKIRGVKDSKLLTEEKREKLLPKILDKALACSVSVISHIEIDRINILQASLLAMSVAIKRLKIKPELILVDGNKTFVSNIPCIPIIDGDAKSFSIAAASIVAKVARDRIMKKLSPRFPHYLWCNNKGYATQEHIEAIKTYGPCFFHRKTFLSKILYEQTELEFADSYIGIETEVSEK